VSFVVVAKAATVLQKAALGVGVGVDQSAMVVSFRMKSNQLKSQPLTSHVDSSSSN
jgi:hypothetical protein